MGEDIVLYIAKGASFESNKNPPVAGKDHHSID